MSLIKLAADRSISRSARFETGSWFSFRQSHAQSAKTHVSKDDDLSENVLELQGVWAPEDETLGVKITARLVVHGSYFLLVYKAGESITRIVEVGKFKANGENITDAEGNKVLTYLLLSDGPSVSFEVLDESPNPTSKYTEFALKRVGTLPDLNLAKAKTKK